MATTLTPPLGVRPNPRRGPTPIRRTIGVVAGLAVFVALWTAAIEVFEIPQYQVPTPSMVGTALVEERAFLWESVRITLLETVVGLAVSATVAIALALAFVSSPVTERALLPFAVTFRSIPIVAMAPLITIVAGRGIATSIFCVTVVTFFPMLVNSAQGFRSVPSGVRELFKVHGASTRQYLGRAAFPTAIPFLFTGLRIASSVGVLGALTAEWLTGTQGLGFLLLRASSRRQLGLLWAGVVVATVTAVAIFALAVLLERALLRRFPRDGGDAR
jgi:NitT/TauT family transport system permease protein